MTQTTIGVYEAQKAAVKDAQKELEGELGTRPTQGETIAIACRKIVDGETA